MLRQNESDPQKALKGAIKEIESYGAPSGSARAADLETLKRWDKSPELVGISNSRTRNYVTWDQDVLDRAKILERNNEILANQLKDKGLLMGGNPVAAPLLMPSNIDPLSDPQRAAEFIRSGGA